MHRRLAVPLVMVALIGVALTACSSAPGGGVPVGPTGRFTIVGRDIVDPAGNRFYPIGANVSVRQGPYENGYTFNWNGTATGHAADAKAWGWNIVRANLICVPPPSPTVAQLNAGIDSFIDEYTAQGIVVRRIEHERNAAERRPARFQAEQFRIGDGNHARLTAVALKNV